MYAIRHLCHRTDIPLGAHGFTIDLSPEFRSAVMRSGLDQEQINRWREAMGPGLLCAAGYRNVRWHQLRVLWGEWGPEHIDVPGNACGLDINRSAFGCLFAGGYSLQPHNVDSLAQKYLLLMTFTELAESVILFSRTKGRHHAQDPDPSAITREISRLGTADGAQPDSPAAD